MDSETDRSEGAKRLKGGQVARLLGAAVLTGLSLNDTVAERLEAATGLPPRLPSFTLLAAAMVLATWPMWRPSGSSDGATLSPRRRWGIAAERGAMILLLIVAVVRIVWNVRYVAGFPTIGLPFLVLAGSAILKGEQKHAWVGVVVVLVVVVLLTLDLL